MNFKTLLRVLTSMINIDLNSFNSLFETEYKNLQKAYDSFSLLEKVLFVRNVSAYLFVNNIKFNQTLELGLFEEMPHFDLSNFLQQVFELDKINIESVSTEQIASVQSMKDQDLRLKFSKTIKGVDQQILLREATKPHGSFEISDMEVPIQFQGRMIYLCIPFKTGVEIRENTVPINAIYQILRPFLEFNSCVVIFVTAKKCSEQLMNYIKKMKNKMNWPIEVIEERTLSALLLYNNQL